MIVRRLLIIFATLLAIIVASGAVLFTGGRLAQTINWLLPTGWAVEIPQRLESSWQAVVLPHFSLSYQGCPLLITDHFRVQWAEKPMISLQQAKVDYACLSTLPKSEERSTLSMDTVKKSLAFLPQGRIEIEQLAWLNLPETMPSRLKGVLDTPSKIWLAKKENNLTACIEQQQLKICSALKENQLTGSLDYQPSENEQHHLNVDTTLPTTFLQLPHTFKANYEWQLPSDLVQDPTLQRGNSTLVWQKIADQFKGEWQLHSLAQPNNQLTFPLTLNSNGITVEQGRVDWALSETLTLKGFLNSQILPNRFEWGNLFPIKTAIRFSLLSENDKGKGNVVFNSPEGEWTADHFSLPINIHGNVKQGNFILYSAVPLAVTGQYDNPTLRFLPTALLRVTGKEQFLTIQDLRFPLAGIWVDKQGINGRLQAIFRGESPDFKQIDLHLDGYAKYFKAGKGELFQDPPSTEEIRDRWQWRFWGESYLKAVKSPLTLAGRGNWQGKVVELSEFSGELSKIYQGGVKIPKIAFNLLEPMIFAYEQQQLTGGLQLTTPNVKFDYGGELEKLTASLNVNGKIDNLNLKGELTSGKLGPIRLFARRSLTEQNSNLLGRLYWSEQPANVFQSLLPFRSNWVITKGTIRGETAFSANSQNGFVAGGHFSIRQGGVSFPNGELKGIEFSLPYLLKNKEVDIGAKQALDVHIAEINLGLPMTNAKLKVQGHYPYSKKRPLFLRELSFELLGGALNIDRFSLPQTQVAFLNLRQIQFEQLLQLAQYHQLALKGQVDATLPFWLSGKPCYICEGTFQQAGSSSLKFTPELLKAMAKSGYTEQLLTYLVNDSQMEKLSGKIQLDSQGNMQLQSMMKMYLTEHRKAKINLNYTHQENLFDLWKLINYGSQFEQSIEHSIYKELDNR